VAAAPVAPVGAAPSRRAVFHRLTVSTVDRLCADAVAVGFSVPPELSSEFAFKAGQYLTLRRFVGSIEERRSYSICSPVGTPLRIGVRLVPDGLFSQWLISDVRPGDAVEVLPPQGSFTPSLDVAAHHCLIAAGSGITPVLSIAASVLAACSSSRVTLIYGNRRTDTVMFAEELAELKDQYPSRLQLMHVLSREPREIELFSGRLDAAKLVALLSSVVPSSRIDEWWLCGPFGMVQDARAVLGRLGVPADRIHTELFYVDEPPPELVRPEAMLAGSDSTSSVTVVLDGRSTTLDLPKSMPILDAAQRVRGDLPFACKGGVCGTCRARVVSGEVHMRRNFALEQAELDAGFALTCQALPVTDAVTVDYDT
jgi:ring-1,2-phenylacetyl-CoA epoxidase subunit PaaE